uniref:Smr protein/MutS2 n=1 Tax=Polynucleobacter necessarius subsp. necessarius (strain STIR1) TaxID=452638 RepID=B1XUY1_POLNS
MEHKAECPDCGNPRTLFNQCPHCGSVSLPILSSDTIEFNIKQDGPYVEEALERLTDYLRKSCEIGIKAIVLIHGYGSSGEGGRIKWAIEYYFGEQVAFGSGSCHDLLKRRPGLKRYLKRFKEGNAGMTVLLLKSN